MAIIAQYSRLSHHTILDGFTFSVPSQEDFTISGSGSWTQYDLALSEIGVDELGNKAFIRIGNNINEFQFTGGTAGATPSLSQVLSVDNTTNGYDISISNGDAIVLDNNSKLKKGTIDAGLGGQGGISQICSIDYELKWEAGRLYVMNGGGATIRQSLYNFNTTPTNNDDDTKGYLIGSIWGLDDLTYYVCSDNSTGAAVWNLITITPTTTTTGATISTTNNTSTTILSLTASNDSVTWFEFYVTALKDDLTEAYYGKLTGAYKNIGGTYSIISSVDKVEKTDFTTATADVVVGTGQIDFKVIGETASNINWKGKVIFPND